jgi:FMN phosphatase YigB (HAD superfamily)
MKAILFDLGDTLETNGSLVPDAIPTLNAVKAMRDSDGNPPALALVSDYTEASSPEQVEKLKSEYYGILDGFGIRGFFEPVAVHVTLSTEVGVRKPDEKIFRRALDKLDSGIPFSDAAFITENAEHIAAARQFGMKGICVKGGPNPTTWDVDSLSQIVPMLNRWLKTD